VEPHDNDRIWLAAPNYMARSGLNGRQTTKGAQKPTPPRLGLGLVYGLWVIQLLAPVQDTVVTSGRVLGRGSIDKVGVEIRFSGSIAGRYCV